mgnify:CR=1 FL=1
MNLKKILLAFLIVLIPITGELKINLGVRIDFVLALLGAVLFLFLFVKKLIRGEKLFEANYDYLLFIFLVVATFSSIMSYYLKPEIILHETWLNFPFFRSLSRLALLFSFFFFFLFLKELIKEKKEYLFALKTHFTVSTIVCILGLISWILAYIYSIFNFSISNSILENFILIDHSVYTVRITSIMAEPLILGLYLMTSWPILISLLNSKTEEFDKKQLKFMILIQTFTLILTFSRSAWLAILIISLIVLFRAIKKINVNLLKIGLIFTLFFLLLASPIIKTHVFDSFDYSTDKSWSTKARLYTIKYALEAFRQHPIFGIGYENYPFYASKKYHPWITGKETYVDFPEVNNYPIRLLAEFGIVGFLIVFSIYLTIMRLLIRVVKFSKDNLISSISLGILLGYLGLSIQSLFYSTITYAFIWFFAALIFGLFDLTSFKNSEGVSVKNGESTK